MRTLQVLAVVQTGILLVLLGKSFFFSDGPIGVDRVPKAEPSAPLHAVSVEALNSENATTVGTPGDDRLRMIIREELARLNDKRGVSADQAPESDENESIMTPESWYRREEVAGQIEFYTSVGSISNMEMQRLQGEISRLDKESAQEMMRKLVGALNSGELEGEL